MGLRIATNIASQSVQKNLKEVSNAGNSELERLSSGKRITKAADDAAGLAIATNLEAQTRGLRQATRNANDGVSLVQTAEGGLNETSNILVRLRELTIQSASDTVGDKERGFLDKEYQQLTKEIDRISESTTFNGTNLLNGNGKQMDFQVGSFAGEQNKITFDAAETNSSSENIGVGVHYLSIPEHPYYQETFGWQPEDYPNAMRIGRQTVSLPLSAKLTLEDELDVMTAVRKCIDKGTTLSSNKSKLLATR